MTTVMITDGGPHSADYWAETTVEQILQLSPGAPGAYKDLRDELKAIFTAQYTKLQTDERADLVKYDDRLSRDIDPSEGRVDAVLSSILTLLTAERPGVNPEHFARPDVQAYLRALIVQHLATAKDVERSWFADANPDNKTVKAYQKARSDHGMKNVHIVIDSYRDAEDVPAEEVTQKAPADAI